MRMSVISAMEDVIIYARITQDHLYACVGLDMNLETTRRLVKVILLFIT